jgi:hypothetical protein
MLDARRILLGIFVIVNEVICGNLACAVETLVESVLDLPSRDCLLVLVSLGDWMPGTDRPWRVRNLRQKVTSVVGRMPQATSKCGSEGGMVAFYDD